MPEATHATGAAAMQKIGLAVHDLCQPLTTLQWSLEIAATLGTPEAYREGVKAGLHECTRLAQAVDAMRAALHAGLDDLNPPKPNA